jgi:hypothetical protein
MQVSLMPYRLFSFTKNKKINLRKALIPLKGGLNRVPPCGVLVVLKMIGYGQNVNTIPRRVQVVLDATTRWYEEKARQVVRWLFKKPAADTRA